MKHKVWFDEEKGVARMKIIDDFTLDDAKALLETLKIFYKGKDKRYIICDFSENKGKPIDNETRRWMSKNAASIAWNKIAFVGMAPVYRVVAKVMTTVGGQAENTGFFKTDEEALAWLKGGSQ